MRVAELSAAARGEIGAEGLDAFYGRMEEAYVSDLRWPEAWSVYNTMRRRDPTLRSMLNAVGMLAQQAAWKAEAASDAPADRQAAAFLDSCLEDMSHTVADFLDDVLTMMPFGWSSFEAVYKRRMDSRFPRFRGDGNDGGGDGLIGWRKLAYRRQSTFDRWLFDANGGMQGWVQRAAPTYAAVELPVERLIHFVVARDGNNPEGISLFESAYEPYHYVVNLQILSGIGWQRAFVGLPVFEFEEGRRPQSEDLATVQSVGEGLVVDERQFVSVPPGVKFHLESTNNSGADSLLNTIKYFRTLMLMITLSDFISLGATERGSWALGSDKSDLFLMAMNGYLDRIAETWTRHGVGKLFEQNPGRFAGMTGLPRITHSPVYKPNLAALGSFIQQVAQYIQVGDEDRIWIRQQAGMPEVLGPKEEGARRAPLQEEEKTDDGGNGDAGFPTETTGEELGEFAEFDGQAAVRSKVEAALTRELEAALGQSQERVLELVRAGQDVASADFWTREREALRPRLLAHWLQHVDDLLRAVILETEGALGAGADWALVNQRAADWARDFVGDEIKGILDTTRAAVRTAVQNWTETGQELPDLVKRLTPTFGRPRAELIASTEVTRAFSEANNLAWQELGLPAMAFRSPAHPRCRCWQRPEILPNREWVIVWQTAVDERVCSVPVAVPWGGTVAGCGGLHGRIVSEGPYLGEYFQDVRARLR